MIWFFIFFALAVTYIYANYRGAPWVPMHNYDVERLLKFADIKPGQIVYEPGCGDARFICAAARRGAKVTGFEISLLPFFLAQIRRLFQNKKTRKLIKIKFTDFWFSNLGEADLIYFWLMPEAMPKLKEKLEREMKPGAKVIFYVWPMPGWEAAEVDDMPGRPKFYLYQR